MLIWKPRSSRSFPSLWSDRFAALYIDGVPFALLADDCTVSNEAARAVSVMGGGGDSSSSPRVPETGWHAGSGGKTQNAPQHRRGIRVPWHSEQELVVEIRLRSGCLLCVLGFEHVLLLRRQRGQVGHQAVDRRAILGAPRRAASVWAGVGGHVGCWKVSPASGEEAVTRMPLSPLSPTADVRFSLARWDVNGQHCTNPASSRRIFA
eukprot:scaffold888_cov246-Pinguiococcus_pyrenoidosus.AAC.19